MSTQSTQTTARSTQAAHASTQPRGSAEARVPGWAAQQAAEASQVSRGAVAAAFASAEGHGDGCPHCQVGGGPDRDKDQDQGAGGEPQAAEAVPAGEGAARGRGHASACACAFCEGQRQEQRLPPESGGSEGETAGQQQASDGGGGGGGGGAPAGAPSQAAHADAMGAFSTAELRQAAFAAAFGGWGAGAGFAIAVENSRFEMPQKVGRTDYDVDAYTPPELNINVTPDGSKFVAKIARTSPEYWESEGWAIGSGDHKFPSDPSWKGKRSGKDVTYELIYSVSGAMARLVKAAEQEHLADYKRAYDLSYGEVGKQINALAKKSFKGDSAAAARTAAEDALRAKLPKLGISASSWRSILIQLTQLSISGRDRIGGHDFDWGTTPSRFNDGAKKAFFDLKKGASNTVGTSSRSIVTYAAIGL